MLGTDLITIGVKNQAPQVSYKTSTAGDSISVSSEFADIKCCDLLDILDAISKYIAHKFSLHGPMPPFLSYMVTCSFAQNDSKNGGHRDSLGDDINTFGSSS